ncbi:MAG: TlpA family protein disulfide reductase, partial [Ignavibacteriae bacterium]|nr:TlpA family protein disulfide reductase [Ignavibacteriota bacterium]
GTFSAEIKTDKQKLGYQVLVYGGEAKDLHSVNGTIADSYEYDGGGDYRSIVQAKNGVAKITFDPKKLPESNGKPIIEFADNFSKAVQAMIEQENADRQEFFTAYSKRKAGKPESFNPVAAHEKVRDLIVAEKDMRFKELLMLRYLSVGYFSEDTTGTDPKFVKNILNTIKPSSPIWEHQPRLISTAIKLSGENNDEYLQKAFKENPSLYVKSELLSAMLEKASKDKNSDLVDQYYKQLMTMYPESFAAKYAEKQFNPNRKIQVGNDIPKFSFDGIEGNTGTKITPEGFKGKWVLIDNWATWCGPCIAELPAIHKIYEKFKDKNFVVLSVSFDREAGDVTKFRNGKFKMPWVHTFSEGVWESEAAKTFEVSGIPKPILIDPNGKIVALEEDLRSDKLEKTLERFVR